MDYVLINDNAGDLSPGDLSVYPSPKVAADQLEPIDVKSGTYVGIFGDGYVADIRTTGEVVRIERTSALNVDLLRKYMEYAWLSSRILVAKPFPTDVLAALKELSFDSAGQNGWQER